MKLLPGCRRKRQLRAAAIATTSPQAKRKQAPGADCSQPLLRPGTPLLLLLVPILLGAALVSGVRGGIAWARIGPSGSLPMRLASGALVGGFCGIWQADWRLRQHERGPAILEGLQAEGQAILQPRAADTVGRRSQ